MADATEMAMQQSMAQSSPQQTTLRSRFSHRNRTAPLRTARSVGRRSHALPVQEGVEQRHPEGVLGVAPCQR